MTSGNEFPPVAPASVAKKSQPRKSTAKKPATTEPANTTHPEMSATAEQVNTAHPEMSEGKQARTATVNLPFVTAQFRAPDVHLPNVPHPSLASVPLVGRLPLPRVPEAAGRQMADAARVVGSVLPEREQVAFFAGLGAVAAFGVIDWPVAGAVAAGTVIAKRARRSEAQSASRSEPARSYMPSTSTPSASTR